MIQILAAAIFILTQLQSGLTALPNHGPVIKAFYAPYGGGSYLVPHDPAINGGQEGFTSGPALIDEDDSLKTLSGYSISGGYFYDWIQGEVSYAAIKTDGLCVAKASTTAEKIESDATLKNYGAKIGYRFSNPGDTSYKWLYLGIRHTQLNIPYNNTEVDSTGFLGGFYGFSSFGLSGPFEFVLTYDIYAGTYRYDNNHLSTDVDININRKFAVDFGLSAGMGIQYEPWDLAIVLKVSPFITWNKYKSQDTGNNRETEASLSGTMIGVEVIFSIPDYRHNVVE